MIKDIELLKKCAMVFNNGGIKANAEFDKNGDITKVKGVSIPIERMAYLNPNTELLLGLQVSWMEDTFALKVYKKDSYKKTFDELMEKAKRQGYIDILIPDAFMEYMKAWEKGLVKNKYGKFKD
jgi:hypothetical protein